MYNDLKRNAEGYPDPTAYLAIKKADRDNAERMITEECGISPENIARFHELLDAIFDICEQLDFHLEGRIVVKDKRTGKIWR